MKEALYVFLGGGAGSLLRYGISRLSFLSATGFPLPTLISNFLACTAAGLIFAMLGPNRKQEVLLLITGFCGGFSTFSAFSLETLALWNDGKSALALLYVAASFTVSLGGAALGMWAGKAFAA